MAGVMAYILHFVQNVFGAAFCVSLTAYLGVTLLFAVGLHQPPPGTKGRTASSHRRRQRGASTWVPQPAVLIAAALVGVLALALRPSPPKQPDNGCPGHQPNRGGLSLFLASSATTDRSNGTVPRPLAQPPGLHADVEPNRTAPPPPLPPPLALFLELLEYARVAIKSQAGAANAQFALNACEFPPLHSANGWMESMSDLPTQLSCLSELVKSGVFVNEDAAVLFERSRELLGVLNGSTGVSKELLAASQVGWVRLSHIVLQQRCHGISKTLQGLRRLKASDQTSLQALVALHALRRLDKPFEEAHSKLKRITSLLKHNAGVGNWDAADDLAEVQNIGISARMCLLGAIREARLLTLALPSNCKHVQDMLRCSPNLLVNIEALVVREAEQAPDADTRFGLGMYWSDVAINKRDVLFFGIGRASPGWVRDANGSYVPKDVMKAEELLAQGEELSIGTKREDHAAEHALRLYQHAKFLAIMHHDTAAESRFLSAARLAAACNRKKLAAHSLTRHSYFLSLRGRSQEALALAGAALAHAEDPFAQYIQATLRRTLGELRTVEDVQTAEEWLGAVAGRLPSKALEEQRASAHAELVQWRAASAGGFRECFPLRDVARVLICLFCRAFLRG